MAVEERPLRIFEMSMVSIGIGGLVYLFVWPISHLVATLFTTSAFAFIFLLKRVRENRDELGGALIGGAIGGILSVALEKIACDTFQPGFYEHEGLDLVGYTLLFSAPGIVTGLVIGLLVWAVRKVR